ncbi:MAG: hypothetical protein KDD95_17230 [Rhodobacteraceae bacterium]|nr:hypothetical protein [Paracoccaceae bacterium]MCB2160001.1 hypothetical protein [Paracoccaceae bacterium]
MNRDPRLSFDATDTPQVLSATLCLAPFDRILPVVAGLFRARYGATALGEKAWCGPRDLLREEMAAADQARRDHGAWVLPHWPIVLSEPEGAGGVTVIEDFGNRWIAPAIARFRPGVTVLSLRSGSDDGVEETWRYTVRRGSRTLRRVEATQDDRGAWQVRATGRAQQIEDASEIDLSREVPDAEILHTLARAAGVDLRVCLDERRAVRSHVLTALDNHNPRELRTPTRLGQPIHDAAVGENFGSGETNAPEPSDLPGDADLAALEQEAQRAVARAKSVAEIRSAMRDVACLAAAGPSGRHRLGSLYSLAIARAHRIDLDCLLTRRLEREWHDAVADTDYAVSRASIEADREKALRNRILRPLARRHEAICRDAATPADLLPILDDVIEGTHPGMDERFREMSLQIACKRARELDAGHLVTIRLNETLLDWQTAAKRSAQAANRRPEASARPIRRTRYLAGQLLR